MVRRRLAGHLCQSHCWGTALKVTLHSPNLITVQSEPSHAFSSSCYSCRGGRPRWILMRDIKRSLGCPKRSKVGGTDPCVKLQNVGEVWDKKLDLQGVWTWGRKGNGTSCQLSQQKLVRFERCHLEGLYEQYWQQNTKVGQPALSLPSGMVDFDDHLLEFCSHVMVLIQCVGRMVKVTGNDGKSQLDEFKLMMVSVFHLWPCSL